MRGKDGQETTGKAMRDEDEVGRKGLQGIEYLFDCVTGACVDVRERDRETGRERVRE